MKWTNLIGRRKPKKEAFGPPKPPVTVDNTYAEIRRAMEAKKINYAYGFGLISEKNRRAQRERNPAT